MLGMLERFDRVCRKHGLRYSLIYGTMLGAVRHQGFIPWDNDADVAMPRPDYELATNHPEWFEGLVLRSREYDDGSGYFLPFAKLYNPKWRAQEAVFLDTYEEHLWLDIFPFDAVPDDDLAARRILKTQRKLQKRAKWSVENVDAVTHGTVKLLIKKTILPIHRFLFPFRDTYAEMDANARTYDFGSTERVGNLTWGELEANWIKLDAFDHLREIQFESLSLLVVPCWDEFLKTKYGIYMQLPSVDERFEHNYRVWLNDSYGK